MGFFERMFGFGHHGGGYRDHHGNGHHGRRYDRGCDNGSRQDNRAFPCPNCRAANAPNSRFCQQCGTSLAPASCAQCGATLQAGTKFCSQCGKASG